MAQEIDAMKEQLYQLVTAVVEQPLEVKIIDQIEKTRVLFIVDCAKSDRGLVIGKQGATIKALRYLIKLMAIKAKVFADIKMIDEV